MEGLNGDRDGETIAVWWLWLQECWVLPRCCGSIICWGWISEIVLANIVRPSFSPLLTLLILPLLLNVFLPVPFVYSLFHKPYFLYIILLSQCPITSCPSVGMIDSYPCDFSCFLLVLLSDALFFLDILIVVSVLIPDVTFSTFPSASLSVAAVSVSCWLSYDVMALGNEVTAWILPHMSRRSSKFSVTSFPLPDLDPVSTAYLHPRRSSLIL